jgi:fructokinase
MTVAVIGEVLVDLVWRTGADQVVPLPGGSPANVAIGLHRLGRPVTLVTCWGDDPPGALVDAHLASTGVDVHRVESASARTMLALAYVDATSGGATYDFLPRWDPVELPVDPQISLLHTGSLAAVVEPGATRVLEACRRMQGRPGHAVAVDLNVRPSVLPDRAAYRDATSRLARVADVVKASDEDLQWLYPELSPESAARTLLELGPRMVVVTHGPRGATGITADHEIRVAAPSLHVVDTIGAGDAFQASLLDALLGPRDGSGIGVRLPATRAELEHVLHTCARAGAIACSRAGAQPPTWQEIQQCGTPEPGSAL